MTYTIEMLQSIVRDRKRIDEVEKLNDIAWELSRAGNKKSLQWLLNDTELNIDLTASNHAFFRLAFLKSDSSGRYSRLLRYIFEEMPDRYWNQFAVASFANIFNSDLFRFADARTEYVAKIAFGIDDLASYSTLKDVREACYRNVIRVGKFPNAKMISVLRAAEIPAKQWAPYLVSLSFRQLCETGLDLDRTQILKFSEQGPPRPIKSVLRL